MADYVSEYRDAFAVPEPVRFKFFVSADIAPYVEALDESIALLWFMLDGGDYRLIKTVEELYGVTHD